MVRNCAPEVRRFARIGITSEWRRSLQAAQILAPPVMLWHRTASGRGLVLCFLLASPFSAGDYFMRRSLILAAAALATLASSTGGASAQQAQRVQVGVLECRGGASVGFIVGSVTHLGCVLRAEGMPEDRYVATIRKVGLDLGITQESALAWGVFAPVARLGPGGLSGDYVGAQGSATLGVGVGGNVLVGGSANSIALQPLSVQGQVGVSIAAGLESLELRPGR
jgi:Protein of unknown function (DUF992)